MTSNPLGGLYRGLTRRLAGHEEGGARPHASEPSRFETRAPSNDTAIEAVRATWVSTLPDRLAVHGGVAPLFADDRITRAIEALGGVDGARILELGPLEGGHSSMLESAGATVIGVESNKDAFLKCLVVKELLQLERCSFLCGDAVAYLESTDEMFDICVACGVLYHMVEPVRLIELMARHADRLFLSTHYYAPDRVAASDYAREHLDATPTEAEHAGYVHELYRFRYGSDRSDANFFGGTQPSSNWLTRDDLLGALEHFGWSEIQLIEDTDYLLGPALSLTATR